MTKLKPSTSYTVTVIKKSHYLPHQIKTLVSIAPHSTLDSMPPQSYASPHVFLPPPLDVKKLEWVCLSTSLCRIEAMLSSKSQVMDYLCLHWKRRFEAMFSFAKKSYSSNVIFLCFRQS